jgi:hypothetical protein
MNAYIEGKENDEGPNGTICSPNSGMGNANSGIGSQTDYIDIR